MSFSSGSWIRQVYADDQGNKRIAISFLPDEPAEDTDSVVNDHDPGSKSTWNQLLGDPTDIDIDDGVAILRIDEEAQTTSATWLPNQEGVDLIRLKLLQNPPEPGDVSANQSNFRACFSSQPADWSFGAKFNKCLPELFT
jgi:hypothetical protein